MDNTVDEFQIACSNSMDECHIVIDKTIKGMASALDLLGGDSFENRVYVKSNDKGQAILFFVRCKKNLHVDDMAGAVLNKEAFIFNVTSLCPPLC